MNVPYHRCSSCKQLVQGPCPHCRKARDRARPNANSRGYCSDRWLRFRAVQLARHPICARCWATGGRVTIATDVDHIEPVSGPDDPKFLDYAAVQSLCHRCHFLKTREESTGMSKSRQ